MAIGDINFGGPNPFAQQVQKPRYGSSPIGNVQFPQGGGQANPLFPQQQPQQPGLLQQGLMAALDGGGQYLSNLAGAKQQATQNNQPLMQQQANSHAAEGNLYQRQGENRIDQARSVLGQSPAGYDIDPYANMALRRALVSSYSPRQISAPAGIPTGRLSGGFDVSQLKPVMDQYYSDNAIRESMEQQQKLRSSVDPNSPISDAGMHIYGPQAFEGNRAEMQNHADARMGDQRFYEDQARQGFDLQRQALQEAINANNQGAQGSKKGFLASLLLKAAPYIAAPFTGGASLMAIPITNRL